MQAPDQWAGGGGGGRSRSSRAKRSNHVEGDQQRGRRAPLFEARGPPPGLVHSKNTLLEAHRAIAAQSKTPSGWYCLGMPTALTTPRPGLPLCTRPPPQWHPSTPREFCDVRSCRLFSCDPPPRPGERIARSGRRPHCTHCIPSNTLLFRMEMDRHQLHILRFCICAETPPPYR